MANRRGDLAVRTTLRAWPRAAVRALFPHFCVGCGEEGEIACTICLPDIERAVLSGGIALGGGSLGDQSTEGDLPAGLDALHSAAPYRVPALRRLLGAWKYERVVDAERLALRLFRGFVAGRHPVFSTPLVVPMPLRFLKRATRGFNQAEALARVFAQETGAALDLRLLRRTRDGTPQAQIDDAAVRAANATGSYRATRRLPPGTQVCVIDDVSTTGATMTDCARALRAAGAARVEGVTFLRG